MNKTFEKYLKEVDRLLKPLPAAERADIVKEIQGSIWEMEREQRTEQQILERLGDPSTLAKAYLGDALCKCTGLRPRHLWILLAFMSLTGVTGIFVIPILGVCAPLLFLCGIISPVAGLVKSIGGLLGYEIPYIMFQFGSFTPPAILVFPISILLGIGLILLGKGAWHALLFYVKTVSSIKDHLFRPERLFTQFSQQNPDKKG